MRTAVIIVPLVLGIATLGRAQSQDPWEPALGSLVTEQVYTPVTPCRFVDGINAADRVPASANGTTARYYRVRGNVSADFVSQGAAATAPNGCGIPSSATAVMVNLTVADPDADGDLRVDPSDATTPSTTSVLNYTFGGVRGKNLANGIAVKLCDINLSACPSGPTPSSPSRDLLVTFHAGNSPVSTYFIADVLGYFSPAVGHVQNTTTQQPSSNFNISGTGTVGVKLGVGSPPNNATHKLDVTNTNGSFFRVFDFGPAGGTRLMADLNGGGNGAQARFSGASGFIDIGQDSTGAFVVEGSDIPRLTVLNAGRVGVGTSTPGYEGLTVHSGTNSSGLTHTDGTVVVGSWVGSGLGSSSGWFGTTSNHDLHFFTAFSNEQVTLKTSGNLGIGVNNPLDKLHVAGNIRVGTGTIGCVKDADGTLIAGTCSSDLRFKKDVAPFSNVLEKVARLQPVNFSWRADEFPAEHFGSRRSFGLIAQDVEAVLPDLVATDENGHLAVNYSKLPLLAIQAVRELKAQNDDLRSENDQLRVRLTAIESLIRRFELESPRPLKD